MKTILSMSRCDYGRKIAGWRRRLLTVCLSVIGVILATKSAYATINRPPFVSWIADQRVTTGVNFSKQYFRILEYDGNTITTTVASTNPTVYSDVHVAPCG